VTDVETPPSGAGVIEERPTTGDLPMMPAVVDPTADAPAGHPPTGPVHPTDAPDPEAAPFGRTTTLWLGAVVVVVLLVSLVLRFWTRSDLWLDEALTVNIAKQPLHEIPSFLRRDGAPPLFYVLLHFWMRVFGTSDLAVRALPGVIGVITLPLTWLAGRRLGGRTVAWTAMLLVATSPFAVRYDTETRMYSLIALLTVLAFLALDRSLRHPRPGNLVAVAAVTGLLLYTQYWALYLIGTTLVWLAFQAWRGRPQWRSGARASLLAVIVGCITFLPWVPTFLYQSRHTGTPWATPANFSAMVNAVSTFAGGGTNQGRALGLIFFALAGLGLFGVAASRHHIDLDIRTRPLGRPVAIIVVGTLAAAIAGGFISNSAFDARYASVVFIPLILLVSIGMVTFSGHRGRSGRLLPQYHHQPDPGGTGGDGLGRPRQARRPGGLLSGSAGTGGQPATPRRSLPPDDFPPGDRARVRQLGGLRHRLAGRLGTPVRGRARVGGRQDRGPDLRGLGPRVPDLRHQVRGDHPDPERRPVVLEPPAGDVATVAVLSAHVPQPIYPQDPLTRTCCAPGRPTACASGASPPPGASK
jgi:hypothetical protein